MILKKYKDDKLYLQVNKFKVDDDCEHLFSTRIGWQQENLIENLARVLDVQKHQIYTTKQVHGSDVEIINDQASIDISARSSDGLVTNKKNIVLATYHADCVPVYFYDKFKKVIGIAHSGWKGSLENISKEVVEIFKNGFSSNLEDIIAAIGPSIGPCCYEVKEDVEKLFKDKFSESENLIIYRDNKIYLDLWEINKLNLLNSGIESKNIVNSEFCTSCNMDSLYSYRKENTKNCMVGAIKLK